MTTKSETQPAQSNEDKAVVFIGKPKVYKVGFRVIDPVTWPEVPPIRELPVIITPGYTTLGNIPRILSIKHGWLVGLIHIEYVMYVGLAENL